MTKSGEAVSLDPKQALDAAMAMMGSSGGDGAQATPTPGAVPDRKSTKVEIEHLDFGYVKACTDGSEMERILKVLKSGREGRYFELEACATQRLKDLKPESLMLKETLKVPSVRSLPKDSRDALLSGLDSWAAEMDDAHAEASAQLEASATEAVLPPVRGQGGIATKPTKQPAPQSAAAAGGGGGGGGDFANKKSGKSIPGGDFRAWDKYDVNAALDDMDADDLHPPKVEELPDDSGAGAGAAGGENRTVVNSKLPSTKLSSKPTTDAQCQQMATNEKEKGNEAFRAGDFEEAAVYYSRSLDAWSTAAVYNNRALANLKLKRYLKTIEDTKQVIALEPGNFKAHVRQANAYKESNRSAEALISVGHALELKPTSKEALAIKTALMRKTEPAPTKKKRITIEEDGDDDNDDAGAKIQEVDNDDADDDEEEEDGEYDPEAAYHKASKYKGTRSGYVFKTGDKGLGYYKDAIQQAKLDEANQPNIVKPIKKRVMIEEDSDDSSDDDDGDDNAADEGRKITAPLDTLHAASSAPSSLPTSSSAIATATSSSVSSGGTPRRVVVEDDSDDSSDEGATEEESSSSSAPTESTPSASTSTPTPTAAAAAAPAEPEREVPAAVLALKEAGKKYFLAGAYGDAAAEYGKALARLASDGQRESSMGVILLSNQAACYTKTGECRLAVDACDTALAIGGSDAKILLRRANANEVLERGKKAFLDYKMVLKMLPANPAANAGLARAKKLIEYDQDFEFLKEQRSAVPVIQKARFSTPVGTPPPKKKMATKSAGAGTGSNLKEKKGSSSSSSSAVNTAALAYDELKAKGNTFVGKKQFVEAAECYTRCIELDSAKSAAYNNRSLCYLRLQKWKAAKEDTDKVLALEPKNMKAMLRRAQAFAGMGAYDEGDDAYSALLKLDPKNAKAKAEKEALNVEAVNVQLASIQKQREEIERERKEAQEQVAALAKSTSEVSVDVNAKKDDLKEKEAALEKASTEVDAGLLMMKEVMTDEVEIAAMEEKVREAKHVAASKSPDAQAKLKEVVDAAKKSASASSPRNFMSTAAAGKKKSTPSKKGTPSKKRGGSPTKSKGTPLKGDALQFMSKIERLGKDPAALGKFLLTITAESLPQLIANRLEADHIVGILQAAQTLEASKGFEVLKVLATVARFDMALMFLGDADRAIAAATFATIKAAAELGEVPCVTGGDVSAIASKYD